MTNKEAIAELNEFIRAWEANPIELYRAIHGSQRFVDSLALAMTALKSHDALVASVEELLDEIEARGHYTHMDRVRRGRDAIASAKARGEKPEAAN